jgi:hypothetical protein
MQEKIPVWGVTLFVYGSITVKETLRLSELKGFRLEDPFYSDIEIRRSRVVSGIEATVTAFAPTEHLAREAAILFFGQMLDALSIKIKQPLYLNFSDYQSSSRKTHNTMRRVEKDEWQEAFKEARLLALTNGTTFLRALGWYRKGLYTEDPFDKFLAFWNSIEIVAGKYYRLVSENTIAGTKDQIKTCFKALWGECENWLIIKGQTNWVSDNYKIRNTIAHGTRPVTIETVKEVTYTIDTLEQVANIFLLSGGSESLFSRFHHNLKRCLGSNLYRSLTLQCCGFMEALAWCKVTSSHSTNRYLFSLRINKTVGSDRNLYSHLKIIRIYPLFS